VLRKALAIKDNLSRRGVVLLNNLCVLCGVEEESIYHMIFNCKIAWLIWGMCYNWLGVSMTNHYDAKSYFMHNKFPFLNVTSNKILIAIIGEIWKHRNGCIFKNDRVDHVEVFTIAQMKVWSWLLAKEHVINFSYSDWCLEPLGCMSYIRKR